VAIAFTGWAGRSGVVDTRITKQASAGLRGRDGVGGTLYPLRGGGGAAWRFGAFRQCFADDLAALRARCPPYSHAPVCTDPWHRRLCVSVRDSDSSSRAACVPRDSSAHYPLKHCSSCPATATVAVVAYL